MNFSGIPRRSKLGQLLRFPLRYIPRNAVFPILQGKLRGYKWVVGSSNHGCWLGSYEYRKQQVIGNTIKPGTIAFDIGAHVGFYTLLFSKLTGASEGKVFAFEPFPPNISYLRKHIAINRVTNVEVLEMAVSDSSGTTFFSQGPSGSTGRIGDSGEFKVKQTSIDELLAQERLPAPHYMKIDIEGAEFRALLGAEATLREFHPLIFLATHGEEVHHNCCKFLTSLGYQLKSLDGNDIEDTDEIFAF